MQQLSYNPPGGGKKLFSQLTMEYLWTYNSVFMASWCSITIWHLLSPKENETPYSMTSILPTCIYL